MYLHVITAYKRDGKKAGAGQNIHNCDFKLPTPAGKVCDVDISSWGPCVEENHFAYHKSTPCIFLKLNKIYGWRPKFYNSSDHLPPSMPEDLKEHIRNMTAYDKNYVSFAYLMDNYFIEPMHSYMCMCILAAVIRQNI